MASPYGTELVFKAKVAEQAERYDDMTKLMKTVVEQSSNGLDKDERNLLAVAYKNAVGCRRMSRRIVSQLEEKQRKRERSEATAASVEYRQQIEGEITALCEELIGLISQNLLPNAQDAEAEVFYGKLLGDQYRYIAEYSEGSAQAGARSSATEAYKGAMNKAEQLGGANPLRLGLMLNYAVFNAEIMNDYSSALKIATEAEQSAKSLVLSKNYSDTTLIVQMLKDNIRVWQEKTEGR